MTPEIDALCDRFEVALERGERPSLRDCASPAAALPELAMLELHHRLAAGEAITAGDYFEQYPEIFFDREAAVRLVGVEYRDAVRRDPSLTEAHFRECYPELAKGQEWSNGPWVSDTAVAGTGTLIQQLPPKPPTVPTVKVDLPDFLAIILQPAFTQHPSDLGRLGDYRILGVLGRGGMGVVLRAANVHSGHPAAIKVMLPEEAKHGRERFLREARAAQKIDHPRVVPIYHVGEANGVPYLVMKLLEGQSLGDRLKHGPPTEMAEIVRIGKEIAEGLDAAHKLNLVHRDLKPDNIWLETGPDGEHVRILDFGLARPIGEAGVEGVDQITTRNLVVGTPAYMSPEQAEAKDVDARTDLWSLGVVLYRLVTKTLPFGDVPVMKVLSAIANHTPKPLQELNPDVPLRLSNLVAKLLEKNREHRSASAAEVIHELNQIELSNRVPDGTTIPYVSPDAPRKRSRRWWPIALAAAIVATAFGMFTLMPSREVANTGIVNPPLPVVPPAVEALRVKFISVKQFANLTPEKDVPKVELRGTIGIDKNCFETTVGDRIRVEVELTRPAYCYVVAFNPNGTSELISPEQSDANVPPLLTDRPRYPSKVLDDYYGLTDGDGLCVIGVVASFCPLPSYTQAIASKPVPKLTANLSSANMVMWADGKWLDKLTPAGRDRATRGQGASADKTNDITQATDWLQTLTDDKAAITAAIGFMVRTRK